MTSDPHDGAQGAPLVLHPDPAQPLRATRPHHTPVSKLMTRDVIAVDPKVDFATVVAALREHHHDTVPVVDAERRVLGMVCASDLLAKLALPALPQRTLFESRQVRALRRRAAAVEADELMSSPAVTVSPYTTAAEAAWLAIRHRVHHLPVVGEHHDLVGMVCLCDLLGVLHRSDAEIRAEIAGVALGPALGTEAATLRVTCVHGRVTLDARTARRSQAEQLLNRVRAVEGVVDVADSLRWDIDDMLVHRPADPL
ncbi:CBS domain-containing protein [Streptacidiphilus sp. EB129]|uniref:CBS domain-containing protein n=1 Tax=Streptacidiphilus sp. EB129 TaxID=3156262 RepID=UPI0035123A97